MATFDVVLVRHLVWVSTGAGLLPSECVSVVLRHRQDATLHLLDDAALWGRPIEDQRFLIHSCR
jgi:hypothetical protein